MIEHTVATSRHAVLSCIRMLALLPYPHVLGIMPTPTVLGDSELAVSAQTGAILPAPCFRLSPCCAVQTAAHALIRAAAYTKCGVECPPKLRAAQLRCLLKWNGRW